MTTINWNTDLTDLPKQDWGKKLEREHRPGMIHPTTKEPVVLRIYSVEPQSKIIGITLPVGTLEGYSPDAILVKAFEKNYMTPSKPKVVEHYGFKQQHAEPIELIQFVFECIFDRACEGEMNRYRVGHSKNYESGRYADYMTHGLTAVVPEDCETERQRQDFFDHVMTDFYAYAQIVCLGGKRQAARRRLGEYRAVESVHSVNVRALWHMARQRSHEYSPNGKEAEPQISKVVTEMLEAIKPYLPVFYPALLTEIGRGYR